MAKKKPKTAKETKSKKRAVSKLTKNVKSLPAPSTKTGRKSKYNKKFCQTITDYFDQEPYEDVELIHYQKDGVTKKWADKKRMPKKLPTLVQFAKSIGVCYATVYNWQNEEHASFHKEFLEAFTRAKELQKDFLIQNGLQGLYNPLFAKFTAINITDMKDKTESAITGADGEPLPPITVLIKNKKTQE